MTDILRFSAGAIAVLLILTMMMLRRKNIICAAMSLSLWMGAIGFASVMVQKPIGMYIGFVSAAASAVVATFSAGLRGRTQAAHKPKTAKATHTEKGFKSA